MSKLPFMPLYVADYESATSFLTIEEDGLYSRTLRLMWASPNCSIPNDEKWIIKRLRISETQYNDVFLFIKEEYFKVRKGRIYQKRLQEEYGKANGIVKARSEAGKRGGVVKPLKNNKKDASKASNLINQNASKTEASTVTVTSTVISNIYIDKFNLFWSAYPKRKGANPKEPARKKFISLCKNGVDPDKMIKGAKLYNAERAKENDPKYTCQAVVFLNQGRYSEQEGEIKSPEEITRIKAYKTAYQDRTKEQWKIIFPKVNNFVISSWKTDLHGPKPSLDELKRMVR